MWWGAAHIVNASGLGLLSSHGAAPDFVTNDLANALVLFGYGLTWSGARVFDGRKVYPPLVLLGAGDLAGAVPPAGFRQRRSAGRRGLDDAALSSRCGRPRNCGAAATSR